MILPITHSVWQTLRYLVRAQAAGQDPLGRELRVTPSRNTKDGTFLDDLVEEGLIEVTADPTPFPFQQGAGERAEPPQFRTRYRLTALGRHAAEYGEYDRPYTPRAHPLTGAAALLAAPKAGQDTHGPTSAKRKRPR
jgi:hypothetical protein